MRKRAFDGANIWSRPFIGVGNLVTRLPTHCLIERQQIGRIVDIRYARLRILSDLDCIARLQTEAIGKITGIRYAQLGGAGSIFYRLGERNASVDRIGILGWRQISLCRIFKTGWRKDAGQILVTASLPSRQRIKTADLGYQYCCWAVVE